MLEKVQLSTNFDTQHAAQKTSTPCTPQAATRSTSPSNTPQALTPNPTFDKLQACDKRQARATSYKRATNAKHAQQATSMRQTPSMRQAPSMRQNAAHPKPQCPGSRQSAQLFPSRGRCRSDVRQERPRKCPLCRRCGTRGMLYRFTFTCMVSMTASAASPSASSLLATHAAST